jgi:hypothetical protein
MQDAAQWMAPIHVMLASFYALPVFLDDFVRKQKHDEDERDEQERAQYYVLDHDCLQFVKRCASIVVTARQFAAWGSTYLLRESLRHTCNP